MSDEDQDAATARDFSVPYIAGVLDARGHIEIGLRHDRPQPRIAVTTRRKELLAYLCQITGTKLTDQDRDYQRRPCSHHCQGQHQHVQRQSAKWRVDSARATIVLWNVRPFIVSQVDEVEAALKVGLDAWPAARGNTGTQMALLGWRLPLVSAEPETCVDRGGRPLLLDALTAIVNARAVLATV